MPAPSAGLAASRPGDWNRDPTGLNTEETPILWFRAADGDDDDGRRAFTASGVFGAAGIMDAARDAVVSATWTANGVMDVIDELEVAS